MCTQIVQTEVNVPVLRNFVEKMYPVAYDLAIRKRNTLVRLYSSYPIQEENFVEFKFRYFANGNLVNLISTYYFI